MTLNFHKKPQRDFVFHFFLNFYYSLFILFFLLFIFFLQHADVHATACWRIGSYAPARTGIWGIHKSSVMNNTLTHMESRLYHILHTVQTLHPLPFGWTQSSKERLRDWRLESRHTVGSVVFQCMNTIQQNNYRAAFSKWSGRLKKCVHANGEYFEDFHNKFLDHITFLFSWS